MMAAERGEALFRDAMRRCLPGIAFAVVMGVVLNALTLVLPLYTIQVYGRVLASRSVETLTFLTLLALAALVFHAILDYVRGRVFMVVGERFVRQLNAQTMEAAVIAALRRPQVASANAVRDLQDLRQFITSGPIGVPFDALMSPMFLVVLYLLHPLYLAVALIGIALMLALSFAIEIIARRPAALANEALLRAQARASAAVRHAEVVEAMGMLPAIVRRWRTEQNHALAILGHGSQAAKAISAITRAVRMALQIAMLAAGALVVIEEPIGPGVIVAGAIIMGRALQPYEQLIDGWRQWTNALSALGRLRALLSERVDARSTVAVAAAAGPFAAEGVGFVPAGHDRAILKGISFALEPGEALGVIGPSGAGKSTLARLLVGVFRPTTGGIYLDGHDVAGWERESFGRHVGYLPQNPILLEGTIADNIARFTDADIAQVIAAAKLADIHETIGRLAQGYETRLSEASLALSGGQRQRIALARALFGNPRLVVLDEPNSNLDLPGEQALVTAVRRIKAEGAIVVLIAHRMSVMGVADKVIVLRDGRCERYGERAAVMSGLGAAPSTATGRLGEARLAPLGEARLAQLGTTRAAR